MRLLLLALISISVFVKSNAQVHISTDTLHLEQTGKTSVKLLSSDSLCSTFVIEIPIEVKKHYHAYHSENIMALEGTGKMILGDKTIFIKAGDIIVVPKGTIHAVISTGNVPLKVISVQSPYFDGKDRIFIEN